MPYLVEGAKSWKPQLVEGDSEWQLRYRCPTCGQPQTLVLQPPPWSVPADSDLVLDPDGRRVLNEQRRAAGTISHESVETLATQLWCHRDGKGADVTIRPE